MIGRLRATGIMLVVIPVVATAEEAVPLPRGWIGTTRFRSMTMPPKILRSSSPC